MVSNNNFFNGECTNSINFIQFASMESFFLDFGFGWLTSKLLPFFIMLIFGVCLYLIVLKLTKEKWMRIMGLLLIVIPFFIYMVINPIYEGDLSDSYRTEKKTKKLFELKKGRLIVLALPGCHFCEESIDMLKVLKSRFGKGHEIDFIVCSQSEKDVAFFEKAANGELNVRLAKNPMELSLLANSTFPAYVYIEKGKKLRVWSNNEFGARAKDWIEERMN